MRYHLLTIVISAGIQSLFAQKIEWQYPSQKCKEAIDKLIEFNHLDYYGYDGWSSSVTQCFQTAEILAKSADDAFLDKLSREYPNPTIRAIAGRILIEKKSTLAIPLVFDILQDSSRINVASFDLITFNNVANFLVDELFFTGLISPMDSLRLNDSLLYAKNLYHIERRAEMLEKLPAEPQYYDLVKRMFLEEHDGMAFITLARFQHEEDTIYLIKNLLSTTGWNSRQFYQYQKSNMANCALLAVAEWPHPSFQQSLIAVCNSFFEPKLQYDMPRSRYFFSAVMAYHSPWALDLIEETFERIKKHPSDIPQDYYDNEGFYSHHYGESFDRAYELYANVYNDGYFDALHQKFGRKNSMS